MEGHYKQSSAEPPISLHSHKLRRGCKDIPGEADCHTGQLSDLPRAKVAKG